MKKITLLSLCLMQFTISAQDTQYWTQAFGTKSMLMGGAVVGGVRDNSAVYYNPGALGFNPHNDLSITADAYQVDRLTFKNGAGQDQHLKSTTYHTMPLIISGLVKLTKSNRHSFGYCVLSKDAFSMKTIARVDDFRNILNDSYSPGDEDYVSNFTMRSSLSDMSAGIAYAYKVSDRFSIGLTNMGGYRDYQSEWLRVTRAIPTDTAAFLQNVATFDRSYSVKSAVVNTFFKLGLAWNFPRWKFGLTATSPSIRIYSDGKVISDVTATNIDYFNAGVLISWTANDYEKKIKTQYKTPFSVGFGTEYNHDEKTIIAFSCEWFAPVKKYNMLVPKNNLYLRPANINYISADSALTISETKNSVFNFAIGFQQKLTEKTSASIGFRTNHTYSKKSALTDLNLTYTNWNLYHFTIGVTQKRKESDISIGINYGMGRKKNVTQWLNIQNVSQANGLQGDLEKGNIAFNSLSVVIGYTKYLK